MSRAELAGAVRSGQVTPRALVLAAFDRIDQHADLNAVITTCRDRALAEAAVHPRTGRLAGLPVLVKDLADAEGMPTSQGSPWFATGEPAQSDDLIVRRLRAEGAIVIGKTNVPAFGHTAVTSNSLFGPTVNPWKRDRSPGGSSGGTACALAAGLSPLATGSDGGGSVRVPASLCGLVGYKPTTGAIGRGGVPRWIEFSTMGVTASTVDDVILEVDVCLGPALGDVLSLPLGSISRQPVMPTRIFASHTLRSSVDPTIARAFSSACELIASETGITVEYVEHVFTDDAGPAWVTIATAELAESLGSYRPRWSEADASLAAMLEHGAGVSLNDYIGALRQRYVETARLETLLGHGAVLLTPTTNVTAWPAQGPLPQRDKLGDAINTVEMNLTGAPAISLPLGTDEVGTPFGLQVIAPRCRDDLALGFAKRWEAMAGWPVVAPGFTPFTLATVLTSSS